MKSCTEGRTIRGFGTVCLKKKLKRDLLGRRLLGVVKLKREPAKKELNMGYRRQRKKKYSRLSQLKVRKSNAGHSGE